MDISKVSDEELSKIAGNAPASIAPDISKISDEDLAKIAGTEAKPYLDLGKAASNIIPDLKNLLITTPKAGYDIGRKIAQVTDENQSVIDPSRAGRMGFDVIKDTGKAMGKGILEMIKHPVTSFENAPVSTAMAAYPLAEGAAGITSLLKGGAKTGIEEAPVIASKSVPTVNVAQQLSRAVPISDEVLKSIASNPEIAEMARPNLMAHKVDIANDAVTAVNDLPKTLKKIGSDIYQKAGIDYDKTSVPVFDALSQAETENAQSLAKANTPDNIRAVKEVRETINNAINKIDDKGNMPFGQVAEITKEMYDNAKSASIAGDTFKQQYYENLGDKLTSAKYQIPEIQKIAPQYQQLMQANDSLNKVFRLNSDRGKITLDTKIENMFADEKNIARMQELGNVYKAIDAHPEYPELQGVKTKIQGLQLVANMEKGKPIQVPFFNKIPILKDFAKISPKYAIPTAGRMARAGMLSSEGISSRMPESRMPFLGKTINTANAIRSAFKPISILEMIRGGK